jgi:hypothetical protein
MTLVRAIHPNVIPERADGDPREALRAGIGPIARTSGWQPGQEVILVASATDRADGPNLLEVVRL